MATLYIGTVEIPVDALLEFTQNYDERGAVDFVRVATGAGKIRELWSGKLSTTIRATGWAPGFDEFDVGQTHEIQCVAPRTLSGSTSIALPTTRRNDTDHAPIAFGIVNGELVSTTITNLAAINAGTQDTATLTAVSGASGYVVNYWPKFVAAITVKRATGNSRASFTWNIEAEEI